MNQAGIMERMQELSDVVPHKLDPSNIQGMISIPHLFDFLYDTNEHREKILEFVELYQQALNEGRIIQPRTPDGKMCGLPQLCCDKKKPGDDILINTFFNTYRKNVELYTRLNEELSRQGRKQYLKSLEKKL